jgi:hypothetical protein
MKMMKARYVPLNIVHLSDFTEKEQELICNTLENMVTWGDQDKCLVGFDIVLTRLEQEAEGYLLATSASRRAKALEYLVKKCRASRFGGDTYLDLMN